MSEIATMISTLGFPIVTAVVLFMTVKYMFDKYTDDIKQMNAYHKEEVEQFTEALNKNTLVLQQLTDKLEGIEGLNDSPMTDMVNFNKRG